MSKLTPLTPESFLNKSWRRPTDLSHAAHDTFCPISLPEIPTAVMALPLAFIEIDGKLTLVAVQSLQVSKNLFSSPDGRWLSHYVPLVYRTYPFKLARAEDDTVLLCFDEESGLLTEEEGHEPFYNSDSTPAPNVQIVLESLGTAFNASDKLDQIIELVNTHELIKPWDLKIKKGDDVESFQGISCIDETALEALGNEAFLELREAGALTLVYCQLLSMQHMLDLARLAEAHQQVEAGQSEKISLDELQLDLSDEGGTLDLSNI